jgi:hypothetical protein
MATISTTIENRVMRFATYTGPASYVTGGDAVTAADFKLSRLDHLIIAAVSEGGYGWAWDPSADKIKAMFGDYDAVADGALIEVATDTDLSAEIVDVIAIGLP